MNNKYPEEIVLPDGENKLVLVDVYEEINFKGGGSLGLKEEYAKYRLVQIDESQSLKAVR